jgi:hypothetical protein
MIALFLNVQKFMLAYIYFIITTVQKVQPSTVPYKIDGWILAITPHRFVSPHSDRRGSLGGRSTKHTTWSYDVGRPCPESGRGLTSPTRDLHS